ncbi:uncharacterized protein LOC112346303 [Selaginella moellendorffii]|uniref:uncharacterized protein LOC112346303 n=1 Tax=Selaginella moellendorffii TaxID=88036 RepID=UPI000D1CA94F|nr:uncharacterized protein LOC112346303 [Selaginella moellendorffii]|eukprot:XP_024530715.1 uncharacterized protein LOC112346303 [Selaginella moellendorffii]
MAFPFLSPPRRVHIHPPDEVGLEEATLIKRGRAFRPVPDDLADEGAFATWLQKNLPLVNAMFTPYGWMGIVELQGRNDPLPPEFTVHLREAHPVEVPNLVPFSDVVCDFTLPFRGRDGLVQKLAQTIDDLHNFRI